jgi:hypothetical protein
MNILLSMLGGWKCTYYSLFTELFDLKSSDVDPDPVGSETFSRTQIWIRIRAAPDPE